jgi:transcriptional regulator with XRE-family HTH domain
MGPDIAAQRKPHGEVEGVEETLDTFGGLLRKYRLAKRLNQLALGTRAVLDNTTISRLETGKQLPSPGDFERLATALNLSPRDRERLTFALQQDLLQRKSIPSELYLQSSDELLFLTSEQVVSVQRLRLSGKPQLAAAEASRYAHWVRMFVKRSRSDTVREALLRTLADLLIEQSKSYWDYVFPSEVWQYATPLIAEQQQIATLIKDPKLALLPDLSKEAALYLSGSVEQAQIVCGRLLVERSRLGDQWQPEVLRAAAINAGYLQDETGIVRIANTIGRVLEEMGPSDPMVGTFLLEGLARGQGLVRNVKALETLERAWHFVEVGRQQGNYSSLKTVQLIRTQLKTLRAIGETDEAEYERLGLRGILLCDELGYARYRKEISDLLESYLN